MSTIIRLYTGGEFVEYMSTDSQYYKGEVYDVDGSKYQVIGTEQTISDNQLNPGYKHTCEIVSLRLQSEIPSFWRKFWNWFLSKLPF